MPYNYSTQTFRLRLFVTYSTNILSDLKESRVHENYSHYSIIQATWFLASLSYINK